MPQGSLVMVNDANRDDITHAQGGLNMRKIILCIYFGMPAVVSLIHCMALKNSRNLPIMYCGICCSEFLFYI